LEFIKNKPGVDIYIGDYWIITFNAMANYRWNDYIRMNEFKVWKELREDIIVNYNHSLQNESIKAEDAPWVHLYNVNVAGKEHIPLNEKLYYDCIY
jgi:hypothetical protein